MGQEAWLPQAVDIGIISDLPRWDAKLPLETKEAWDPRNTPPRQTAAADIIAQQLTRVSHRRGGTAQLLLLILDQVEEAWEVSYIFGPLWDTLRGAHDCFRENRDLCTGSGSDARATRAALALLASLDAQIRAEDALMSGLLMERAQACDRAAEEAQRAIDIVDDIPEDFGNCVRDAIYTRAISYVKCYATVGSATRALAAFYEGKVDNCLEMSVSDLYKIEKQSDLDPIMASELRANRFSLMELWRRRADRWLHIDRGKLVYIYPFGFKFRQPLKTVTSVRSRRTWRLAGAEGCSCGLELNDIWASSGLENGYSGQIIRLPDIAISTPGGRKLEELDARIVVSSLGNHYVRFETKLNRVSPPDLYDILIRAAPESGRLSIEFTGEKSDDGDGGAWPRLSALASNLVNDLAVELGYSQKVVVCRSALYHVIMSVEAASTTSGVMSQQKSVDRIEALTSADLSTVVGTGLLTNPIPSLVGSMAEWIRYANPSPVSSSMEGELGESVVRTCNTTSIIALGQPNFVVETLISMTELVASLGGLMDAWSSELFDLHKDTDELEQKWWRIEQGESSSEQVKEPDRTIGLLQSMTEERTQIETFSVRLHATEVSLSSPSLVASPLAASTLRELLDISDYWRKLEYIHAEMEFLSRGQLDGSLYQLTQRLSEINSKKQANKVTLVSTIVAAIGISGLAQLLQSGYQWHRHIMIIIVAVVVAIAIVVGVVQQTSVHWPRSKRN